MTKYNLETKEKAVFEVLKKNKSVRQVEKELGIPKSVIQRWITLYKKLGLDGIADKKANYTSDFKLSIIKYMQDNELSYEEASADFGMPSSASLYNWVKIYEEGADGLYKKAKPRPIDNMDKKTKKKPIPDNQEDLIEEIKRLRAENDYLKKLNALIHEKEISEKRKSKNNYRIKA